MESTYITTIKTVISKSGKLLYYESTDIHKKPYWTRIGKDHYEYYVRENKDYAIEIKYDDNGLVVFMRYRSDPDRSWAKWGLKTTRKEEKDAAGNTIITLGFEKIKDKKPKGCAPAAAAFLLVIALLIFLLRL